MEQELIELKKQVQDLEKEVSELKESKSVINHYYHYLYPQPLPSWTYNAKITDTTGYYRVDNN